MCGWTPPGPGAIQDRLRLFQVLHGPDTPMDNRAREHALPGPPRTVTEPKHARNIRVCLGQGPRLIGLVPSNHIRQLGVRCTREQDPGLVRTGAPGRYGRSDPERPGGSPGRSEAWSRTGNTGQAWPASRTKRVKGQSPADPCGAPELGAPARPCGSGSKASADSGGVLKADMRIGSLVRPCESGRSHPVRSEARP